jgi:hypothetical protein
MGRLQRLRIDIRVVGIGVVLAVQEETGLPQQTPAIALSFLFHALLKYDVGDLWNTQFTLYTVSRREAYCTWNSARIIAVA